MTNLDTPRGALAWTTAYDAAGDLTSEKTPLGHTSTRAYNARNELTRITAPSAGQSGTAGRQTNFAYDDNGNQRLVDAPGANGGRVKTQRLFDGRDLLWAETTGTTTVSPTTRTTVTEYDANGNLRRVVKPEGVSESTKRPNNAWDGSAPTRSGLAAQHATVYEYSAANLLSAVHLPFGAGEPDRFRQDFVRDGRGRVEAVDAPYAWTDTCGPGGSGPGCAARTSYTHFDSGWTRTQSEPKVVDPDSGQEVQPSLVYDYDARGNQTLWRTRLGVPERRIVTREFHPNGLLAQRSAKERGEDPAPQRSYEYEYNPNGSLVEISDLEKSRTTGIAYDEAERPTLVNERWTTGKDTAFAYDDDGRLTTRRTDGSVQTAGDPATYQGGTTTSFGYDAIARETATRVCLSGAATCAAGSADRTTTSEYFDGPYVKARRKPNGVVEAFSFFDDGRLASMKRTKGDAGAVLKDQSYSYDRNGNRTTDERGTHVFNARDQLVEWTRGPGQKQPAGSTVTYELNGSGAMTERVDSATGRVETYSYLGSSDRLREVVASEPGALPSTATYRYDPDGFGNVERIEQPGQDTLYGYDAFGRMKSSDGPGTTDEGTVSYDGLDRRDTKTEPGRVSRRPRMEDDLSSGEETLRRCHEEGSTPRSWSSAAFGWRWRASARSRTSLTIWGCTRRRCVSGCARPRPTAVRGRSC